MTTSGKPGPWVEAWLSGPRFATYLTAMAGDRRHALRLYDWIPAGGRHWVFDPARYFPARWRTARNGVRYNANREPQRLLAQATQAALTAVQAAARASG